MSTTFKTPDYDLIHLTNEETMEAIKEGKKKKYFLEKHGYYWLERDPDLKERKEKLNDLKDENRKTGNTKN